MKPTCARTSRSLCASTTCSIDAGSAASRRARVAWKVSPRAASFSGTSSAAATSCRNSAVRTGPCSTDAPARRAATDVSTSASLHPSSARRTSGIMRKAGSVSGVATWRMLHTPSMASRRARSFTGGMDRALSTSAK